MFLNFHKPVGGFLQLFFLHGVKTEKTLLKKWFGFKGNYFTNKQIIFKLINDSFIQSYIQQVID